MWCLPRRLRLGRSAKLFLLTVCVLASLALYNTSDKNIATTSKQKPKVVRITGRSAQACVRPEVPVWTQEVFRAYNETVAPIVCRPGKDWVYTENGKVFATSDAINRHGGIKCMIAPIINVNDSFVIWKPSPVQHLNRGAELVSDAFAVSCVGRDGARYNNVHPCISHAAASRTTNHTTSSADMFNILMYGFDSMSRNSFKRLLPKTHSFFTETLGGKLLEGYNIVGDGTTQALLPLLTGNSETELPESRRGRKGAKPIDELVTFIWKRYSQHGYVTQWGEDMAHIGTFQFRLLGFKEQPVDHYMRAYQLFAPTIYGAQKPRCLGSRPRHVVFTDWLKEGLMTNRGKNFFTFGFFSEYSHERNNPIRLTDDNNVELLKFMQREGFLDNTILILMSDHGIRYGPLRNTEQGKLEERMPYFGFRFPDKFNKMHENKLEAFEINTDRLTTPFDIHETLVEILDEAESKTRYNSGKFKGQSLFTVIPESRTCHQAGIDAHWCACMQGRAVNTTDEGVRQAAEAVVAVINQLLQPFADQCHKVVLENVERASVYSNNREVLRYKGSLDRDGRFADLSDTLTPVERFYQVVFTTSPRQALFEATVTNVIANGTFVANAEHISRLNVYGSAPDCIAREQPQLRPYCVCRSSST